MADMVVIDGVRYRADEVPTGNEPAPAGLVTGLEPSEPMLLLSRRTEEELAWKLARSGPGGYPKSTGGSGRGGYQTLI